MNIGQSITSLFTGGNNTSQPTQNNNNQQQNNQNNQQQNQQQPNPGNMQPGGTGNTQNNTNTAANGTIPTNDNTNNQQQANKNPLDAFNDLWETPKLKEGEKEQENMFNVDPVKLREAAGKVPFDQVITPEIRATIAKGGEEGVNASISAMNTMVQSVYAQSALATTKIVEKAINDAQAKWDANLPNVIKRHNVGNSLREENPAMNHAAVAPLISALESKLVQKYPNATTKEINDMAKDYMRQTFTAIFPEMKNTSDEGTGTGTGNVNTRGKQGKIKEENWEEFLSM